MESPLATSAHHSMGRYQVGARIASGGMGSVFIGCCQENSRKVTVAVKAIHPHLASDFNFVAMLMDEARVAQCIIHPNVVGVKEFVVHKNDVFLVMEYVHGASLASLLSGCLSSGTQASPTPIDIGMTTVLDALAGLHAAHTALAHDGAPLELIHRDVSPHNIMVGTDGISRLTDFGVARSRGRLQRTEAGMIKGKLAYIAPEVLLGKPITQRVDTYAIGVVLWELLVGRRLFDEETEAMTIGAVLEGPVPPPSQFRPSISKALDAVVRKAIARDPKKRFDSAESFAAALREVAPVASLERVGLWVTETQSERLAGLSMEVDRLLAPSAAPQGETMLDGDDSLGGAPLFAVADGGPGDTPRETPYVARLRKRVIDGALVALGVLMALVAVAVAPPSTALPSSRI
jgi:eukaryotic-like serine/threonine-protein kinase